VNNLFVTTRLPRRRSVSVKMRWVQSVPQGPSPARQPSIGCTNGGRATDALAQSAAALETGFLPWATYTLLNTHHGRRLAQAALKLCGSLEQRRDLRTCPTFLPLNAEFVVCRTSKMESLRSVPLRFPEF
jgi:hypothetical protein